MILQVKSIEEIPMTGKTTDTEHLFPEHKVHDTTKVVVEVPHEVAAITGRILEDMGKQITIIEPTEADIEKIVDELPVPKLDAFDSFDQLGGFDRLGELIAEEALNRIAQRIRYSGQALKLIEQLAAQTSILTTLANAFGIEDDDMHLIMPSFDPIFWNVDRMRNLAVHIHTFAKVALARYESAKVADILAKKLREEQEAKAIKIEERVANETSVAEGLLEAERANSRHKQEWLSRYSDQEMYVVAKIDPTTLNPKRYYLAQEDSIRSLSTVKGATTFSSLQEARDFRVEIIQALRSKVSRVDSMTISDTIAVMQISLYRVKHEYEIEGEPDA